MIVDVSGSLPTAEFLLADLQAMCGTGYLPMFGPGVARWAGMDAMQARTLMVQDPAAFVQAIWRLAQEQGLDTVDNHLGAMTRAGIDAAVIHNFHEGPGPDGSAPLANERLAEIVAPHADRLLGFAGMDPRLPGGAESVEQAARLGLRGVGLRPFRLGLHADDRACYPIYERCEALGLPVWLHSSIHYERSVPMDIGHPRHLDRVATDFPGLNIVAGHGGWPWTLNLVAVAMRQPNVWIDVSAVRPRYLGAAGSGWEPVLNYGGGLLKDRMVTGLDWLMVGRPPREMLDDFRALPLRPEVVQGWLGENAARLFKLQDSAPV